MNDAISGWITFDEGARMIGRLLRQRPSIRTVAPINAIARLLDDVRAGEIESTGIRYSTGELERISRDDWSECDPHFRYNDNSFLGLREPGRRLPRFVNIYVNPADIIQQKYAPPIAADVRKGGRLTTLNSEDLHTAYDIECEDRGGRPDTDGPEGWKCQADVERFIMEWAKAKGSAISEAAARRYAKEVMSQGPKAQK